MPAPAQLAHDARARLHYAERPAQLRRPSGRHISLALDMIPATAPAEPAAGDHAGQPGVAPAAAGCRSRSAVAQGLAPGVTAGLRHRRLRPARRRVFGAGAELRPELLLRRPPELHPGQCRRRAGAHQPGANVRRRLRAEVRLAAALHDHRGRGPRPGLDPRGVRRVEDQLLRVLLRHVHRPGLRHLVSQPGPPHGPGQHRRSDRGLVRRQYRPGLRFDQGRRRSTPGWPTTTGPTISAGPPRSVRAAYYRARNRLAAHPINGQFGAG